jgi:hypothetical protein
VILRGLRRQPLRELDHAGFEPDPRLVAEQLPREGDVGEAVPDVTHTGVARRLRRDLDAEHRRQLLGEFAHRQAGDAADVDDLRVRAARFEREPCRARNVVHRHEVASLEPVLVDERRLPVQKPRREDREHAVYGFDSACRGPYTLQKRSGTAGIPYASPAIRHARSC